MMRPSVCPQKQSGGAEIQELYRSIAGAQNEVDGLYIKLEEISKQIDGLTKDTQEPC